MALISRGCKLDPTLVSALVERWKFDMHTFYIPCSEYTITLEDVQLHLKLLVDGPIVTRNFNGFDEDSTEVQREQHAQFEWTPYFDMIIQECILSEFLVNPNIWHVKVPLVMYATVEMYESDRLLRRFRFCQSILMAPLDLNDLHLVDLRGKTDGNWTTFHAQHINI
ncbi:hypothetical protein PVK06_011905 [Gossypium arboreum]|uniref:Aminotransferase-like plant mobile domain-containing protein n=1 Tax=Gossypium arboreum TaxID=29729 RepID=A0ABR0QAU2_GOSAR|nr:hypothetical protein PVK06_011905 [Gossypium arboreum]